MRISKYFSLGLILICMICVLSGCTASPKTFETDHVKITLTKAFEEGKLNEFDTYLKSDDVVFTAREESISDLEAAGYEISSLHDYCMEVLSVNKVSVKELKESGKYYYFVNTQEVSGTKYTYVHCMFEGTKSYWICEFVCKSKDYDKYEKQIKKWADSIEIKN